MTNTSKPELTRSLRDMIVTCLETSSAHRVPGEVPLALLAGYASAVAGHLFTFNPDGHGKMAARLSFLLTSGGSHAPSFFTDEVKELERRQTAVVGEPTSPLEDAKTIGSLRRRQRVLKQLDGGCGLQSNAIDVMIAANKSRKKFAYLHRVDRAKPGFIGHAVSTTLVVEGAKAMKMVLNSQDRPRGYWSNLGSLPELWTMVAWLPADQWSKLTRDKRASALPGVAWIVPAPESHSGTADAVVPQAMFNWLLRQLEMTRFGGIAMKFEPSPEARELLDRQVEQFQEMQSDLWGINRYKTPMPDVYLGWKLAAIFSALCGEGRGERLSKSTTQASKLGCLLADWMMRQHVRELRSCFPSLVSGPLTATVRSILRALTPVPTKVRDVQRTLRGVDKDACVAVLEQLVAGGLAIKNGDDMYSAPPASFGPGVLSEFLSEFGGNEIYQQFTGKVFPATTDKHPKISHR